MELATTHNVWYDIIALELVWIGHHVTDRTGDLLAQHTNTPCAVIRHALMYACLLMRDA